MSKDTCGAHDEECINWYEIHEIFECDNCYHWCLTELRKINNKNINILITEEIVSYQKLKHKI